MRAALLAVAVLLAACGSRTAQQPAATEDAAALLERDLAAVVAGARAPTYKATYELRQSGPSPAPTGALLTQTYASRPPDVRIDYAITRAGATQLVVALVARADGAYLCMDLGISATCYAVPSEQAREFVELARAGQASPFDLLKRGIGELEWSRTGSQRIADRDGVCFAFRPKPGTASATGSAGLTIDACFTASGIPLRVVTTLAGGYISRLDVTSISDVVTDGDLALPYPVTAAPFPGTTAPPRPTASPR